MINCALIGHGYWGKILEKYLSSSRVFRLVRICDSKSDLDEVWSDDSITATIIAVRNEQRYSITRKALISGKNVLSEKPLALKTTQAEYLQRLSEYWNKVLVTDYTFTLSRSLLAAVNCVAFRTIGELLGVDMRVNHLGKFGGGNVYWILGSHMLAVLGMFVPLETLVYGKKDIVVCNGVAETGVISFSQTVSNLRGQISISLNYPGKEVEVVLYGSKGTIVYDPNCEKTLIVRTYERKTWVIGSELLGIRSEYYFNEADNLKYIIEYFGDVIQGEAESNIHNAVAITRILEELNELTDS